MKASELIRDLQTLIERHGDLEVAHTIHTDDCGYEEDTVDLVLKESLKIYDTKTGKWPVKNYFKVY